jgi:hypothetical protein
MLFALLAFLGLVAATPLFMHFSGPRVSGLPLEVQFLAGITFPAVIAVWLADTLAPGGS